MIDRTDAVVALVLYRGSGTIIDRLIRWWTGGPYSHCEIMAGEWCYSSSARDVSVRQKQINLDQDWVSIPLPKSLSEKVLKKFEETQGHGYSWVDLIRSQVFNRRRDQSGREFCSEWCASALGLPSPTSFSPSSLSEMAIWLNDRAGRWHQ